MPKYTAFTTNARGDSFQMPTAYYEAENIDHDGDVPGPSELATFKLSIKLARHHIIWWALVREVWNKAIGHKLYKTLDQMSDVFVEQRTSSPSPTELCWARRNLIIGPDGDDRMFDPGDELDFEAPLGMTGARQRHVAAMVELGKLMRRYKQGLDPKVFEKSFSVMHRDCKTVPGEQICVWRRKEWVLNQKPLVTWHIGATGSWETKSIVPGLWHRSGIKAHAAAKYWRPNAQRQDIHKETAKLRKQMHTKLINKVQDAPNKERWKFLTG